MKSEMTGKERILAALRRQPVDRVPWVPLLVPYTIAGFPKDTPHRVAEAQRAVGCDIWTQSVADRIGLWMPKGKSKIKQKYIVGYDSYRIIRDGWKHLINGKVGHVIL